MELPQCSWFPVGFAAVFEAVPYPGVFSVFALWGTSLYTQGLVLPSTGAPHLGGQGAPPSSPSRAHGRAGQGGELSLSWNPSNCLHGDFWGIFPSFLTAH